MDRHALAILEAAESWNWPAPSCMEHVQDHTKAPQFKTACRKLLSCLVMESYSLGGTLVERFWHEVGRCHPQLSENIQELESTEYSSSGQTEQLLFDGVAQETVNFAPVFELAADLFTHLGLAFMNSENRQLWKCISPSTGMTPGTSPAGDAGTQEPHRTRPQEALKLSALKRDGTSCPISKTLFFGLEGVDPVLVQLIPYSVCTKPDTLNYIALLGGQAARDKVVEFCNGIDNVLALEPNTGASHRLSKWGIEACHNTGDPHHGPVQYFFRTFSHDPEHKVPSIPLRDGDEIAFGAGPDGKHQQGQQQIHFHCGPHPVLCNLRLAVGRALHTSGAADFITQLMEDADDTHYPHDHLLKEKDFHDVLNAKLLISGRARIV